MNFPIVVAVTCAFLYYIKPVICYIKLKLSYEGPIAFPIIGHLYLLGPLPHHSLMQISKRYGPLVKLRLGSVPVVVASSPDMAKEFLKTHDVTFASRPSLLSGKHILYDSKDMVFAPYGEHWRNIRKVCMLELLTDKRLAASRSIQTEELNRMLKRISQACETGQPFVVLDYLVEFTFNVITRMLMNKVYFGKSEAEDEETKEFIKMQDLGTIMLGEFHIGDYIPFMRFFDRSITSMKKLHKIQDDFLQKVIDEHLRKQDAKHEDFIDILLSLPFADRKEQIICIKALIQNLLGAGTDTSITVIQFAMAELLNHPAVLNKAQQEIRSKFGNCSLIEEHDLSKLDYFAAVIKEIFRLHPPAPLLIPHESIQDCEVANMKISKGTRLFVNVYAIGRDPSLWESPEEFMPERFLSKNIDVYGRDFELLPFGAGRRGCPGLALGLVTVQLALANLLHRFNWSLPRGMGSHPMRECFGVVTTMKYPLRAVAKAVYIT